MNLHGGCPVDLIKVFATTFLIIGNTVVVTIQLHKTKLQALFNEGIEVKNLLSLDSKIKIGSVIIPKAL